MCGLAGLILSSPKQDRKKEVQQLIQGISYRGPDATGFWRSEDSRVNLGHARLSIIDLHNSSNQPLHSTDHKYTIVFNGEIYNYKLLRQLCIDKGSSFHTSGDTEVIIEMYRHYGADCFKQFRGMWALCLYDHEKNQIILSRDHFGIKPLYYAQTDSEIYFASEPLTLSRVVRDGGQIDEVTKELFLKYGVIERGQWTFFKNIKKFPQSCYAVIGLDQFKKLSFKTYWDFKDYTTYNFKTLAEWTSAFKQKFTESMELHTVSDVPFGTTLSGGLDSSGIAGILKELDQPFETFSTDFSTIDKSIDESFYINEVTNFVDRKNHKTSLEIKDFVEKIDSVILAQGEPFLSCSILSQYFIYQLIQKHKTKVVLGGQGADEILGGYDFLQRLLIKEQKSSNLLGYLKEVFRYALHNKKLPRIVSTHYYDQVAKVYVDSVSTYINFVSEGSVDERLASLQFKARNYNDYLKFLVFEANLPQLLKYEDRNSMNFSIESRVPFLDPELVNFCLQVPEGFRFKAGLSKFVLREAIRNLIPESVRLRMGKLGFPGPDKLVFKEITGGELDGNGGAGWRKMIFERWEGIK